MSDYDVLRGLVEAAKKASDGMDRAGGDGHGMPECPWCHRNDLLAEPGTPNEDRHDADCHLLALRAAVRAAESAMGKGR